MDGIERYDKEKQAVVPDDARPGLAFATGEGSGCPYAYGVEVPSVRLCDACGSRSGA